MIDLGGVDSLLITGTNGFVGRSIIDQIAKIETQYLPDEIFLVTRQGHRMTYFLRTIGYSVLLPTPEESERANANQPTQSWPEKGSVSFDGAIIIVKLSS